MNEENNIILTRSKLNDIIGESYVLGWNGAFKLAERKDLVLDDE